jgi:hypothetical protein
MGRTAAGTGLRRLSLTAGGLLALVSGAWFVIGPLAWPVLVSNSLAIEAASSLRELAYQVGYALGPGLILAAAGAFAIGWTTRHNRLLGAGIVTTTDARDGGNLAVDDSTPAHPDAQGVTRSRGAGGTPRPPGLCDSRLPPSGTGRRLAGAISLSPKRGRQSGALMSQRGFTGITR